MKKNNRIKLTAPTIRTREQLDAVVGEIRDLTISRNRLMTLRDEARKAVDDRFTGSIDNMNEELALLTERVKTWADANPAEFTGKRSIETTHGTVGWRLGQWQCNKVGGWLWLRGAKTAATAKIVLEALKKRFGQRFVRVKEEVDEAALIAARSELSVTTLQECGVELRQEDAFYVDPKIEQAENRQTAAA